MHRLLLLTCLLLISLCCNAQNPGKDVSADIQDAEFKLGALKVDDDISIGSFNIQRFGRKKMSDEFVLDILYQILPRYDLVLIQELQDSHLEHVGNFMEKLKQKSGKNYGYVISESLGRKTYKEQYLYIYREDMFEIVDKFVYDDGSEEEGTDTFAREPFCILLKSVNLPVEQLAFVGAHIDPDEVPKELDEMKNVHEDIKRKWGEQTPVVFMGDFNADGSYLRKKEKENLILYQDKSYHWLLENEDTTLAKNDYNYDRFIVYGDQLLEHIIADSATAYKFDEVHGLDADEAKRISDHYPVEFLIRKASYKDEL